MLEGFWQGHGGQGTFRFWIKTGFKSYGKKIICIILVTDDMIATLFEGPGLSSPQYPSTFSDTKKGATTTATALEARFFVMVVALNNM